MQSVPTSLASLVATPDCHYLYDPKENSLYTASAFGLRTCVVTTITGKSWTHRQLIINWISIKMHFMQSLV